MPIKTFHLAFLIFLMGATACKAPAISLQTVPRIETVAPEESFPVTVPRQYESTRGWLIVAEDRANPLSPEIRLPITIVHARTASAKSPVIYLSGGPGTFGLSAAAYPGAYPWLDERDFVVFGQRGTHAAKPALMCPEYREAVASNADRVTAIRDCRERVAKADIVPENYNSNTSAADIEDLRKVLNVEQWSIYGVSYGTRLALTYAREYESRIHSMVLDSPLPPNAIYDDESARNFEASLRAIAEDCASQPSCDKAFPDLEKRFFETVADASAESIKVSNVERPIAGAALASLVSLNSGDDVEEAPMIMDAIARLDEQVILGRSTPTQASDFAWGMRLSVWCSEALPFSNRSRMEAPGRVLGGFESAAIKPGLCDAWNVPAADESVVDAVVSAVPTLIIAGEFDPLTPPSWGHLAAETLSNSLVVSVRGESHLPTQQWGGDGCAMALAAAFVEDPIRVLNNGPEDHCVYSRRGPDYQTELP